jgi:hypothetical protein
MLRTLFALLILLASSTPIFAQVPGCVRGLLTEPGEYFAAQAGITLGTSAPNWQSVLNGLVAKGWGINPAPNQRPNLSAPFFDFKVMVGSDGQSRGRLFLPAAIPQDGVWFTADAAVIEDDPAWAVPCWQDARACRWTFKIISGIYSPPACGQSEPSPSQPEPPIVTPPPTAPDFTAQIGELNAVVDALRRRVEQLESNPPRVLLEDALLKSLQRVNFECRVGSNLFHGHACAVTVGGFK